MFCRVCGKQVGAADSFCASCGQATSANVVVQPPQIIVTSNTSATKVALGVLIGMVALIILLVAVGNVGVDGIVIFGLAILAILVAAGAFRKQLR